MKIIDPSFRFLRDKAPDWAEILARVAEAGRVCYQSEPKTDDATFVRKLIKRGHESVLEHVIISVRIICDRGVSHELVRHRIASYSQESTRYCNYGKDKFGGELTFIRPPWVGDTKVLDSADWRWTCSCQKAESDYKELLKKGWTPEQARAVLPNSLKTEIVVTMNLREWRHFFRLRCDRAAHPQMRQVADMLLEGFRAYVPVVFDDLSTSEIKSKGVISYV